MPSQDIDAKVKFSYFSPSTGKSPKFLLVITEAELLLNQRFIVGCYWFGSVLAFWGGGRGALCHWFGFEFL